MCCSQLFKTFGSSDDAKESDVLAAVLFDKVDSGDCGTAGSKHGVYHENLTLVDIGGKLAVVLVGFKGNFVTVQTDVTDLCSGHQL